MSIMKRGTKNTIFRELFMKNSGWFVMELACSYLAAKVLLLGNNRISDAIDAMFAGNLGECIDRQFWIYVGALVVLGFAFTYIQSIATKIFAANMQTGFRAAAGKSLCSLSIGILTHILQEGCSIISLMMLPKYRIIIRRFFRLL